MRNWLYDKYARRQGQYMDNGPPKCRSPKIGPYIHGLPSSKGVIKGKNQAQSSTVGCVPWSTARMRFVFKVPYDTRRTITACKVSFVRAAWIPWQGNQRLRATANDPYRPLLFRHTHRRRPTNNMDEVLSPTSTCRPSVRPSVSRRAFVLRYIVQACLLRETNGAPLVVHFPPCLNFLRREIHRSPELRSISGPPSSVYYPITHTVLPYYLQVHSLSLSLSLSEAHTPNRQL